MMAAIIAPIKATARGGIQPRALGRGRHGVDIPIQPLVQALPRLPLISAAIDAALFDANVYGTHDLRVGGPGAHRGEGGGRGEGPGFVPRNMADGPARPPATPAVVTPIQQ